jgi:energy-coupling factor transporter ATP-binding protein EcfA2
VVASAEALFLTGTSGVGKSTTLQALSALLSARDVPHAAVDVDQLQLKWPVPADDPFNRRLGLQNLRVVAPNLRVAGAERLVLAHILTGPRDLEEYAEAAGVPGFFVCRLRASEAQIAARLRARHERFGPWELQGVLDGFWALHRRMEEAGIGDAVIDIDECGPLEVAEAVVAAVGW